MGLFCRYQLQGVLSRRVGRSRGHRPQLQHATGSFRPHFPIFCLSEANKSLNRGNRSPCNHTTSKSWWQVSLSRARVCACMCACVCVCAYMAACARACVCALAWFTGSLTNLGSNVRLLIIQYFYFFSIICCYLWYFVFVLVEIVFILKVFYVFLIHSAPTDNALLCLILLSAKAACFTLVPALIVCFHRYHVCPYLYGTSTLFPWNSF